MAFKFIEPVKDDLKKVLVYGYSGTGKSTFAANYCKEYNLNPIVLDVEGTNRTRLYSEGRVLDVDLSTDKKVFRNINNVINELERSSEFDTLVFDGFTTCLDWLVSDAGGQAKYGDRTLRFQKLLQKMMNIGKNIIIIGQIDAQVIWNEEKQSNKSIIRVDSLVNERYLCEANTQKTKFWYTQTKKRTLELTDEALIIDEPEVTSTTNSNDDDPIHNSCMQIKIMLEKEGRKVNKATMKSKVIELCNNGTFPMENRPNLIEYIQKHCPEELE